MSDDERDQPIMPREPDEQGDDAVRADRTETDVDSGVTTTSDPVEPPVIDDSGAAPAAEGDDGIAGDIGAFLLDALPQRERDDFDAYLADREASATIHAELIELAPAVALLPRLLELDDPALQPIEPSAGLRDRILTMALGAAESAQPAQRAGLSEPVSTQTASPAVGTLDAAAAADVGPANDAAPTALPTRPQGRIRSGVTTVPETAPTPIQSIARAPRSWLLAASLAVIAVGSAIWALALMGQVDDRDREVGALSTQVAGFQSRASASVFTLQPTPNGPAGASGTFYATLDNAQGALVVDNLSPLQDGRVYQLWFIQSGGSAPVPGATFTVDENGRGVLVVTPDAPAFDTVALTEEPTGGSAAPTTPVVLAGSLGGARG